jgi:hypothetical protein
LIGVSSIWPKLLFLLVFLVFLTAFISGWSQVAKRKAAVTGKLLFGSIFFVLWGFLIIQLFVREVAFHYDLANLRSGAVKSIEVGDQTLDHPNSILGIVNSLNGAQWFEANHGGWADEVPLVLHFRSGEQRTYHVAFYLRQEGAVLISMSNFDRTGKGSGWSNGVAFLSAAAWCTGCQWSLSATSHERDWSSRRNKTLRMRHPPWTLFKTAMTGPASFPEPMRSGRYL